MALGLLSGGTGPLGAGVGGLQWACVLVTFCCCCDKMPDTSNLKKGGLLQLTVPGQSIMVEEQEADDHLVPTLRKQKDECGCWPCCFPFSTKNPSPWNDTALA